MPPLRSSHQRGPDPQGLSLIIYSFLYSLTQSLNKHELNTYCVLDAGERVEGQTGRLPAFRKLTCVRGDRQGEADSRQTQKRKTVGY